MFLLHFSQFKTFLFFGHSKIKVRNCVLCVYAGTPLIWHREACLMMPKHDHEERIFLSYPHTNNRFYFLLTIQNSIFIFDKRLPEVPEYAEMRHTMMMSLLHYNDINCLPTCNFIIFIFPTGWHQACEIEFSCTQNKDI